MFPLLFSRFRVLAASAALVAALGLPLPLLADTAQESAVIAEPAPAVVVPEPVTIRAEPQPVAPATAQKVSPASRLPVRSLFSMLPDEKGELDQAAAAARVHEFRPYAVGPLSRESGTLWLYLDLADVKDVAPHTLWLDLGTQIPSGISVWLSADGRTWQKAAAESKGVYGLLSAGNQGQVLVRMDGLPGLWFNPALCSPHAVMTAPDRLGYLSALAALGLLGLLSLLLSLTERGEGRFWIGALAFAAMAQVLWGVPSTPAGAISPASFPGIFAAGVALFMLPHAGRVLMRTRLASPFVDMLFLLFALPGACAAILPFLPGMAWTARLLELWPLAALLCLAPAFVLVFRGIQGSGPFMLACLSMGGGAAVSLWGMIHGWENPWWGVAVELGQALGVLFLTSAAPHREAAAAPEPALDIAVRRTAETRANTYRDNSLAALRRAFRGTVEELFDEACRLDQALTRAGVGSEKVDIMTHADGMVAAARRLSESALDLPPGAVLPEASLQVFELRQVIQKTFASVFDEAEKKGLGLAWYVAPQIGQKFRGDAARLTTLLTLLLSDSVRASSHGAVSLHVRRSGASTHPGHLQFTVSDNGEGLPPRGRQSMLLARAWELAAAHGGELYIESSPQGMELSFSMEFAAMEADGVTERSVPPAEGGDAPAAGASLIILASPDGLSRQLYAHYLDDMGFCLWEARDAEEAAALYAASPASLVIFDGSLGEDDMVQGLAAIRMFEGEQALPAVPFLLLARDDMQAERMAKAGCDEALLLPVVRKDLRALVRWLIAPTSARPVLSTQRITLAAVLAGAHSGTARMQSKAVRKALSRSGVGGEVSAAADEVRVPDEAAAEKTTSAEETSLENKGGALSLEGAAGSDRKEKGWLSSLFRSHEREEKTLNVAVDAPAPAAAQDAAVTTSSAAVEKTDGGSDDGEVVELLAEQVLVEESGVHELTDADRVPDADAGNADAEEELIELDSSLIHEEASSGPSADETPEAPAEETSADVEETEDMTPPMDDIVEGLNRISDALLHGDVQAIRSGSRALSSIADRYGMHTLADMARCFRAAWEEGDVEAAAQIVEEMRTEASRL